MPGFTWRPSAKKAAREYERVEPQGAGPSGRPAIAGASSSRGPGSTAEPCPLGTVRVSVVRSGGGQGIGGATVTLAGLEPKRTDGAGKAAFEKIAPADYEVTVTLADGDRDKYLVPPPCTVTLPASSTAEVTVEVEPLAGAMITAKDEKGKGVPGVVVILSPGDGGQPIRATTGKDGVAKFAGLLGATYTVSAELAPDHALVYRAPLPVSGVEVPAGETKSLDLTVPSLGVQTIKVMAAPGPDASGKKKGAAKPMGDLPVRLVPAKGAELAATTDAKTGIARFEAVRPGPYTVHLDLGAAAGRFQSYQPVSLEIKAPDNPERTIELELLSCRLKQITVKEILGEAGETGMDEKPGRTFLLKKGGGGSGIEVKENEPLQLIAPRKGDLFKQAPASLAPLPFNPPVADFRSGVGPTWLEIELDGVTHVVPPATEASHPALVVQTGSGDKVVDGHGILKSGRFLIWGPDFPWNLNPPTGSTRFLKKLGYTLAELFNGITKRAIAPSYWDLYTSHCDEEGNPVQSKTTLAVFPGDRYQLKLNIPAIKGFSYGVNGDYIQGEKITKTSGTSGLIGDSTSHSESSSAEGTEVKDTTGRTTTTTGADGTQSAETETVFASLFQGEYGAEPMVNFTRNGQSNPLVSDLVTAVLFSATEAVKWFSELGNLQPQWGWWMSADISLLKVSIGAEWGWMPKPKANEVDWLYQVTLGGTLIEIKVGIRAGVEGTVVPSLVYFRAVIYLEVGGTADAEWKWTSDKRPTEQKVSTTASLELGVDLVVGNANFCQAKSWIKAPYTLQWNILAPDPAEKRESWDVNFRHGCKDGVSFVAKYKLFYGKYSGTKKIELKKPVPLD